MAKPVLGPEDLAPAHQEGGHRVAQPVEADSDQVGLGAQLGEPVAQGASREAPLVVDVPREDPFAEWNAVRPAMPRRFAGPPQFDGGSTEGKPPSPLGLGWADFLAGDTSLNVQNPAVQVAELERSQLAPASNGVGRKPRQQSDLFGLVE
jgi:hypothetical protein